LTEVNSVNETLQIAMIQGTWVVSGRECVHVAYSQPHRKEKR